MIAKIIQTLLGRWQIALGVFLLLVLSHGLAYCKGKSDERSHWKTKLEAAAVAKREESLAAREAADGKADERADEAAKQAKELEEIIDEAEATGTNPLDALFGSVSEAD